jgi:hypothetical protein
MNLTVGPLPPAVYWRRRALVAGVILVIVILFVAMCSGSGKSGSGNRVDGVGASKASSSPSSTLPAPIIGGTGPAGSASPGAGGSASAGVPTGGAPTGAGAVGGTTSSSACADSEIELTPTVQLNADGTYTLTLKVRNISSRTCTRDVGADPQELVVLQNGQTAWSSDSCQAVHGKPDVRSFGPNIEATFSIAWDGTTGSSCTNPTKIDGSFQVVAKLGTKSSSPLTYPASPGK